MPEPAAPRTAATAAPATERLSSYWKGGSYTLAQRAYVGDLDHLPDSPGSIAAWIDQAIAIHAALTPAQRAADEADPDPEGEGTGSSSPFLTRSATLAALDEAIILDRTTGHGARSRGGFISAAVRVAAARARERAGGELPVVTGRLPNKPVRRS